MQQSQLEWSIAKQLCQLDCNLNAKITVVEFAQVIGQEQQLQQLED